MGDELLIEEFESVENKIKHGTSLDESIKILNANEDLVVFLNINTSGVENPYIIGFSVMDFYSNMIFDKLIKFEGEISKEANAKHGIKNSDLSDMLRPSELEDEIIEILKGKIIVSYNSWFYFEALRNTFNSNRMIGFINEIESKSINLMVAAQEVFRFKKNKKLSFVCEELDINLSDNLYMIKCVYQKLSSISKFLNDDWMCGFEDIFWSNMNLPEGTELSYWSSKDNERHILYSPKSVLGSEKVCELSDELNKYLENFGEVRFFISRENSIPNIVIKSLSIEKTKEKRELIRENDRLNFKSKLENAKVPVKGKLVFSLNLECYEINKKRFPDKDEAFFRKPNVSIGDVLYLKNINLLDGFESKDIVFLDSDGIEVGHLKHITDQWIRCLGIMRKGYLAEVHVIDKGKVLKTEVRFSHR